MSEFALERGRATARRRRRKPGPTKRTGGPYLTNQAALRLADWIRAHWGIEALHHIRDTTFADYAEQTIMPRGRWAASLSLLRGLSAGRYSA